jgi:hypothetical protein
LDWSHSEKEGIKMAMEMFIRRNTSANVTIRKNGSICISRQAIEEYHLEGQQYFTLHFDLKASLIGIKLADDKNPSAFRISKEKGGAFTIGCQAFLKAAKIPYSQGSIVLKAEWDAQNGMIVLKIR